MPTIDADLFCAGDIRSARILLIGHDRRLNRSATLADTPFFADYYLRPIPHRSSELAKYRLAEAIFAYVGTVTSYHFALPDVALTNLCNSPRPHAPAGKTVLIPEDDANAGVQHLRALVAQSRVELILAMSQQVNYWLQDLGFSSTSDEFLKRAAPRPKGVTAQAQYYQPSAPAAFPLICGKRHFTEGRIPLYPILHVKSWPLRGAFARTYAKAYETLISDLKGNGGVV